MKRAEEEVSKGGWRQTWEWPCISRWCRVFRSTTFKISFFTRFSSEATSTRLLIRSSRLNARKQIFYDRSFTKVFMEGFKPLLFHFDTLFDSCVVVVSFSKLFLNDSSSLKPFLNTNHLHSEFTQTF